MIRPDITNILRASGLDLGASYSVAPLSGDGSDRRFYRICVPKGRSFLLVFPGDLTPHATGEALSCYLIGSHLALRQVPVPKIYFFDRCSGGIIYEDLGDLLLHDLGRKWHLKADEFDASSPVVSPVLERYYRESLDALLAFQIKGLVGFKAEYCWQSVKYDKTLILAKETGYFLDSYCRNFVGLSEFPDELDSEFYKLATRASQEPAQYLLHRDFQSRNIMIHREEVRIIDFQGARFGPLAYDVASLVNDPYVELPHGCREFLLDYYVELVQKHLALDRECFLEGYYHIALLRNLQVLGAFAFLSMVRGKNFFRKYISPAVHDLSYKLSGPLGDQYPILTGVVKKCIKKTL